MKDNLTLAHSMTCTTPKKAIMVVLFFRFYCVLYVALLESLVVRVLCVLFLFIYFLTCFQSVNKK